MLVEFSVYFQAIVLNEEEKKACSLDSTGHSRTAVAILTDIHVQVGVVKSEICDE